MAYLGWNPVGAPRIQGVQGRYFLLALPFALVALPGVKPGREEKLHIPIAAALVLVLAVSALAMLSSYTPRNPEPPRACASRPAGCSTSGDDGLGTALPRGTSSGHRRS
jgi:hypothetical protein